MAAVEGGDFWLESRRLARTWWHGDLARAVALEQLAHDEAAPQKRGKPVGSNDGGCAYPWPLKVGQSFECQETVLFVTGVKIRHELKFKVEAAEAVDTPAGPERRGAQAFNAPSTSSSIFLASPNSMRLFSL